MTGSLLEHLTTASIQGAVFVASVWIVCHLFRKLPAVWKCWLWRMCSAKFLLGLVLVVSLPVAIQSPVTNITTKPFFAPFSMPVGMQAQHFSGHRQASRSSASPVTAQVVTSIQPLPNQSASLDAKETKPETAPPAPRPTDWPKIFVGLWLAGALAMLGRAGLGWRRARQLTKPGSWFELPGDVLGEKPIRLRVTDELAAPALIGFVRPSIFLPSDYRQTSEGAVASAIAHEAAHLERRDITWMLVAEVVKWLFWFHPFAWLSCRAQRMESEIAADQLAREKSGISPKAYAEHLLEWIDPSRQTRLPAPLAPGVLSSTHEVGRRLKEMAVARYQRRMAATIGSALALPLAVGLVPLMFIAIRSQGLANSPWPKFHGNALSNGQGGGEPAKGRQKWVFHTDDAIESTPVVGADGTIYVGSSDCSVYAIDGIKGTKKWAFKTEGTVMSSPAIGADGSVFVGSEDGKLYALDSQTGKKKWSFATGGLIYGSPTIGPDGTVYTGSWDANIYALDGATGAKKWLFPTDGPVTGSPAIGADGTLYVGSHGKSFFALDGKTGRKKWSFSADDALNSPSVGPDNTVYIGSWDGNMYALDGATGEKKWAYQTGDQVDSCPAIGADGTLFFGSSDRRVYALDSKTGDRKWAFVTDGPVYGSPSIGSDGTIYVGSADGKFYALVGQTGWKKWALDLSTRIDSSPAIDTDGTLYFGGNDGRVYALN